MLQPKTTDDVEEFFHETLKVAAHAAAAHQITKLIKTYPSQRWRSAVVAAYVTCSDDMAKEIAMAFNEAIAYVFQLHNVHLDEAKGQLTPSPPRNPRIPRGSRLTSCTAALWLMASLQFNQRHG